MVRLAKAAWVAAGLAIVFSMPTNVLADCPKPRNSLIDDALKEHRPGFTRCDVTANLLRKLKLPMSARDLEAALGAPGVEPSTGKPIAAKSGPYRLHWDGPHSFWNADIGPGQSVERIEAIVGTSDAADMVTIDRKGLHHW